MARTESGSHLAIGEHASHGDGGGVSTTAQVYHLTSQLLDNTTQTNTFEPVELSYIDVRADVNGYILKSIEQR